MMHNVQHGKYTYTVTHGHISYECIIRRLGPLITFDALIICAGIAW